MEQYLPYILGVLALCGGIFVAIKNRKKKRDFLLLALAGDSIMKRTQAKGPLKDDNWEQNLTRLGNYKIYKNTGRGGRTTQEILEKQLTDEALASYKKAGVRAVITDGGINDILHGVDENETIKNIHKMRQLIEKHGLVNVHIKIHECEWEKDEQRHQAERINKDIEGIRVNIKPESNLLDQYHPNGIGKDIIALCVHKELRKNNVK